MYEVLHDGADLLSYSQPISRKDAVKHRNNIHLYTKRVRSRDYVRRLLGSSKYRRYRKPGATIGWMPIRVNDKGPDGKNLILNTNRRNSAYPGTTAKILGDWCKEGTIKYVGNIDKLGQKYLDRYVRCVLPFVVEEKKPRLVRDFRL